MTETLHIVHGADQAHIARGYGPSQLRRSSAFYVAPEGAAETPRGFKGYTLRRYASNNTATLPRRHSVPLTSPTPRCDDFDFTAIILGEDEPEGSVEREAPVQVHADVQEQRVGVDDDDVVDEDGVSCCGTSVIGPMLPVVGGVSMLQVGWSGILQGSAFIWWRLLLCLFSLACCVVSLIEGHQHAAYFVAYHELGSFFGCLGLLVMALRYRVKREESETVHTLQRAYALAAILYQAGVTLCLYAALVSLAALRMEKAVLVTGVVTRIDVGVIMGVLLALLLVVDVLVTPVPFRLPYVFGIAVYASFFTAFSVRMHVPMHIAGEAVGYALGVTIVIGVVVCLYGRTIYLRLHHSRVLFALKTQPQDMV